MRAGAIGNLPVDRFDEIVTGVAHSTVRMAFLADDGIKEASEQLPYCRALYRLGDVFRGRFILFLATSSICGLPFKEA
jgi:hypothetical protein